MRSASLTGGKVQLSVYDLREFAFVVSEIIHIRNQVVNISACLWVSLPFTVRSSLVVVVVVVVVSGTALVYVVHVLGPFIFKAVPRRFVGRFLKGPVPDLSVWPGGHQKFFEWSS